jgi:FtsH-binding integral membrane protein
MTSPFNFFNNKNNNNYGSFENQNNEQEVDHEKRNTMNFIKKVYSILTVQLLIVVSACLLTMFDKSVSRFQRKNKEIFYVAMVLSILLLLLITCVDIARRKVPINYILLFIFTVCEAYMVSYACAVSKPKIVLMAASMTCGMVLCLTLYACITDTDYTQYGAILFGFAIVLMIMSIFLLFTKNKTLYVILCALGVFLFSIYIIYDTQLILRKGAYSLGLDDYIVAPMFLFVDIVGLFMNLLGLMNFASSE